MFAPSTLGLCQRPDASASLSILDDESDRMIATVSQQRACSAVFKETVRKHGLGLRPRIAKAGIGYWGLPFGENLLAGTWRSISLLQ